MQLQDGKPHSLDVNNDRKDAVAVGRGQLFECCAQLEAGNSCPGVVQVLGAFGWRILTQGLAEEVLGRPHAELSDCILVVHKHLRAGKGTPDEGCEAFADLVVCVDKDRAQTGSSRWLVSADACCSERMAVSERVRVQ